MTQCLTFQTKADFVQAAFDQVAKIISDHSMPCLDSLTPAISAERCLTHLATVVHDWSYDATKVDAYASVCRKANEDIIEAFGADYE